MAAIERGLLRRQAADVALSVQLSSYGCRIARTASLAIHPLSLSSS